MLYTPKGTDGQRPTAQSAALHPELIVSAYTRWPAGTTQVAITVTFFLR